MRRPDAEIRPQSRVETAVFQHAYIGGFSGLSIGGELLPPLDRTANEAL